MCEMFGREIDVTEEVLEHFKSEKSQVRQYQDRRHERNGRELEILKKVEVALEKMDSLSRIKKNMHLLIKDGIQKALKELKALRYRLLLDSFEYLLKGNMV